MAMIKDALSALPAKPALFIAPLLVILVLTLYYRDQYDKCAEIKNTRTELNEQLRSIEARAQFRLADFTDFAWNKVRIVAGVKPGTINDTCPLNWNWESGERDSLVAAGLLTALVFGQGGKVIRYLELRGDEVAFAVADVNLTPETAVFTVSRKAGRDDGVILILKE